MFFFVVGWGRCRLFLGFCVQLVRVCFGRFVLRYGGLYYFKMAFFFLGWKVIGIFSVFRTWLEFYQRKVRVQERDVGQILKIVQIVVWNKRKCCFFKELFYVQIMLGCFFCRFCWMIIIWVLSELKLMLFNFFLIQM